MDELANFEGCVLHIGEGVPMVADDSFQVQLIVPSLVDGTPDLEDPEVRVRLTVQGNEAYTLAEAVTIAGQLAGYVRWLRHGS